MKVAVSATHPSMDSAAEPRFGRCACFVLVESDDLGFEAIANIGVSLGGGAGIQAATLLAGQGVKMVLTGNCGPNAHQTLTAAGIGVVTGCSGTVSEVMARFKRGEYQTTSAPNVGSHAGMGQGG